MTLTKSLLLLAALATTAALAERQLYRLSLSALQHLAKSNHRRAAPIQRALEDVGAFAVEGLGERYAQALQTLEREAPTCLHHEVCEYFFIFVINIFGAFNLLIYDSLQGAHYCTAWSVQLYPYLKKDITVAHFVFSRV